MKIDRLELRLLKLPLVHFFETSFGRIYDKHCIIVRLDAGGVSAFGECVAEQDPYYSAETNETAWHIITAFIAPRVVGVEFAHPRDVPPPDLVLYLQAPTDVLLRRIHTRRSEPETVALQPDDDYVREMNEAYHHFFFHYNATPLLVVETSQFDSETSDEALDDLIRQVRAMGPGTQYWVPRTR